MLSAYGVSRHIALTISHFLLAPAILEQTDLIATLPQRMVTPMAERFALTLREPPFDLGETQIFLHWPRHLDANPGVAWLRAQVQAVGQAL